MMAGCRKLRSRNDTRKDQSNMDLREHPNPYKRQYTAIEKPGRQEKSGTEKSQRVVILRQKKAVPRKLRHTDRKYQERQSPSDDAGTDENNEAEKQQGEDGETEANKQEGDVQDQILRFHQGVDELSKVLVAGLQKDNDSWKNQVELQNSEYVTQLAVLKNQNETLMNQVEKKTIKCGVLEQAAEKLNSEVELWKSACFSCHEKLGRKIEALETEKDSFKEENDSLKLWKSKGVDCAVRVEREVEAYRKEIEALRTEKDSFKDKNDSLKRQVEKSNTICAQVGQIAAQLNNTVELLKSESVKVAGLKNQNKSLQDHLVKWKTDCEKAEQARKELESQLTAFWTKLGIATPRSTSSDFGTPPTTERKTISSPKNEDAGN